MADESQDVTLDFAEVIEKLLARITAQDERMDKLESVVRSQQQALQSLARIVVTRDRQAREAAGLIAAGQRLIVPSRLKN